MATHPSSSKILLRLLVVLAASTPGLRAAAEPAPANESDIARWKQHARNVTIVRDDWGIPHVYGKTDADAVFGLIYAQAEDDFNRVETNYLNSMGRLAEAEGESALYRDLRMKLFIDPTEMKALYLKSPPWLRALMDAWADGLNYYLRTHPSVRPRVITRFEPWMPLTFSEGSIGGDIEHVSLAGLEAFYGKPPKRASVPRDPDQVAEPTGSNGIAIAPSHSASHRALLLINPHTSFFFRAEAQVVSEEGLDAYGAVTWGQFFVYQGFNEHAGWMHTSSGVDAIDEYKETIVETPSGLFYRYGTEERPVTARTIVVPYKTTGGRAERAFTVYRTHHGPVVREADGHWISVRLMEDPLNALTQSYTRTKAADYDAFRRTMELHTNSSNNTVFADSKGNTAYFHANFVPKRDTRFDWKKPVDGSDPATDWKGVHSVEEGPLVVNPANGWLYNTNNWPYSAAGADSPKRGFPSYFETGLENLRGLHAIRVLDSTKDFTLDSLIAAAYDSSLPAFAELVPVLVKAYDETPESSPLKARLGEPVRALRAWDFRWATTSVPTSLAVFWCEEMWRRTKTDADEEDITVFNAIRDETSGEQKLEALAAAVDRLVKDFGRWSIPWGDINRFQRLTGDIVQPFDDAGPSIPVGFTASRWGSLASFGAAPTKTTKKRYGTSGNSFVAVVEFGERVRAKAITAGGQSGDPRSRHFNDQAERYSRGELRDVYFYRPQLAGHIEREYHPGQP